MVESGTRARTSPRSYLYVPGDQPERLAKALDRGADALLLDLEDAVAPQNKALAREHVGEWIAAHPDAASATWVRITAEEPAADLQAISGPVAGIMLPRDEPELHAEVVRLLAQREHELGLPEGGIGILPLIETARGLLAAPQLAAAERTVRLAIGRADLAGELGLGIDHEGPEFRALLLPLVVASAAARIAAPVAPTSTDFRDLDALRESTRQLLLLGFRGRTAVHPAQLAVINEVFSPSAEEVERAERLVTAFRAAERVGSGVTTDDHGRMVDAAVVRAAIDTLQRAGRLVED